MGTPNSHGELDGVKNNPFKKIQKVDIAFQER
jgi:hypothetical protein